MSQEFRCSASSLARSEPLLGTASTVMAFLLIEDSGPWGVDAVRDCRLPKRLTADLLDRVHPLGIRPLLIRRHGRSNPASTRVFAAYADPHLAWMQTAELDNPHHVLDLDLEGLASGRSAGLAATDTPIFLTCTHGKHDPCCAEQGRPIARALAASHPDQSWEVSHIGGDRFAGNVLVLPDGLYYGHLDPRAASALATQHRSGHIHLHHLRGRCGYGFAVQAAEIYLRRHLGETGLKAIRLESQSLRADITEAVFLHGGQRWVVTLRRTPGEAHLLTCGSRRNYPTYQHQLGSIEPDSVGSPG
ncbi:MAG: sucrase ferredoxin [Nocardioidaceae bacterium]|nr:sucrase ferredoxin [Nocardioidaceae bacterium]